MTSDGEQAPRHPRERVYAAERPKAFFDAVVAIAMTLLILPLMESVGEVADASGNGDWAGHEASARLLWLSVCLRPSGVRGGHVHQPS